MLCYRFWIKYREVYISCRTFQYYFKYLLRSSFQVSLLTSVLLCLWVSLIQIVNKVLNLLMFYLPRDIFPWDLFWDVALVLSETACECHCGVTETHIQTWHFILITKQVTWFIWVSIFFGDDGVCEDSSISTDGGIEKISIRAGCLFLLFISKTNGRIEPIMGWIVFPATPQNMT